MNYETPEGDKKFGWIGVDLDRTLAHYEKWQGELTIGPPIPRMVERVKAWLVEGYEVRIFTARVAPRLPGDRAYGTNPADIERAIQDWLEQHIGARLKVTCIKDVRLIALYDDRAVQVEANTGRVVGLDEEQLV